MHEQTKYDKALNNSLLKKYINNIKGSQIKTHAFTRNQAYIHAHAYTNTHKHKRDFIYVFYVFFK